MIRLAPARSRWPPERSVRVRHDRLTLRLAKRTLAARRGDDPGRAAREIVQPRREIEMARRRRAAGAPPPSPGFRRSAACDATAGRGRKARRATILLKGPSRSRTSGIRRWSGCDPTNLSTEHRSSAGSRYPTAPCCRRDPSAGRLGLAGFGLPESDRGRERRPCHRDDEGGADRCHLARASGFHSSVR